MAHRHHLPQHQDLLGHQEEAQEAEGEGGQHVDSPDDHRDGVHPEQHSPPGPQHARADRDRAGQQVRVILFIHTLGVISLLTLKRADSPSRSKNSGEPISANSERKTLREVMSHILSDRLS